MDVFSVYANRRMIQTDTVVRVHPVHDDLFAIRQEITPTVVSSDGPLVLPTPDVAVREFLIDRANLAALISGQDYTVAPGLALFPSTFRETVRTRGWPNDGSEFHTLRPYTSLVDGEASADDIIRVDHGAHMIFDAHGRALPVSLVFDYINGDIRERSFDLPKLAAHLLTRDDVIVYARETGYGDRALDARPRAKSVKDAIAPVHGYNAGPGSYETITFRWMPDVESYRVLWKHCLEKGVMYPSSRLRDGVFALDLLGIAAAGCKVDRVYEEE